MALLIDTHAHLEMPDFAGDLEAVLARAAAAGVGHIITVGTDLASSRRAVDLAGRYPMLVAAVGVHPHDAAAMPADGIDQLERLARSAKVVAVGEMGLDYYRDRSPRPIQRDAFAAQLDLARRLALPAIIHCREAHEDAFAVLAEARTEAIAGVMHCFSGDANDAVRALDRGLLLSFTGVLTFPNARRTRQVAKTVPLERTILETDCPYMAPQGRRGRRNEPALVVEVAQALAAIHGVDPAQVAAATTAAARVLFRLEEERP